MEEIYPTWSSTVSEAFSNTEKSRVLGGRDERGTSCSRQSEAGIRLSSSGSASPLTCWTMCPPGQCGLLAGLWTAAVGVAQPLPLHLLEEARRKRLHRCSKGCCHAPHMCARPSLPLAFSRLMGCILGTSLCLPLSQQSGLQVRGVVDRPPSGNPTEMTEWRRLYRDTKMAPHDLAHGTARHNGVRSRLGTTGGLGC